MVNLWVLIFLSIFSVNSFAQVGPGGLTPRNCLNVTDGSNTVSCASKLTVSGGTVSGSNPNATLTVTGGGGISYWNLTFNNDIYPNNLGNVGIGTIAPIYNLELFDNGRANPTGYDIGDSNEGWNIDNLGNFNSPGNGSFAGQVLTGDVSLNGLIINGNSSNNALEFQSRVFIPSVSNVDGNLSMSYLSMASSNTSGNGVTFQAGCPAGGCSSGNSVVTQYNTLDDSNGNAEFVGAVGIGQVAGEPLDVLGTTRTTSFTLSGHNAQNGYTLTATDSAGDATWSPASGGGSSPGGSATNLQYQVNGTTFGGVSNSSVVNGNIGLGSANPGQILDVTGSIRSTGFTLSGRGATQNYVLTASDSAGDTTWKAAPVTSISGDTYFISNSSSTGAVTLTAATHTQNTVIGAATSTTAADLTMPSCSASTSALEWTTNTGFACHTISAGGTPGGGQNAVQYNNASAFAGSEAVFSMNGTNVGIGTTNALALLQITGTNDNVYFTSFGNVGIGSVTPGQALDVNGTIRVLGVGNLILPNGNVGIGTTFIGGTGEGALSVMNGNVGIGTWNASVLFQAGNGTTPGLEVNGSNLVSIGTHTFSASLLTLGNGTFQVTNSGNTTINTLTSAAGGTMITLSGANPNIHATSATAGSRLEIQGGNTTTSGLSLSSSGHASDTADYIDFNVNNDTSTPISIIDNGASSNIGIGTATNAANLGIGVASPGAKLDVLGTLIGDTFMPSQGGIGIGTTFVGNIGEGALSVMNGNVGIATWVPGANLDIEGTIGTNYFGANVGIGTTLSANALDVNGGIAVGASYAGYKTTPSNGMIIQSNVGIGTTVTQDIMTVQGSLLFRGNLAGGTTGNVGISTTQTAAGATCDSSCNTAGFRCFLGLKTVTVGIEPCSVSIVGDCLCLPAS